MIKFKWQQLHKLALVCLGACVLSACGSSNKGSSAPPLSTFPSGPTSPPKFNSVTFTAQEYSLIGADGLPAGLTAVSLQNNGKETHQMVLAYLTEMHTPQDIAEALKTTPNALPTWAQPVGGPNMVPPGGRSTVVVNLQAGTYLYFCLLRDAQGNLHINNGMSHSMTANPAGILPDPATDASLELTDTQITLFASIAAGERRLRVTNVGAQLHDLVIVRLDAGKTGKDYTAALSAGSATLPGQVIGGVTMLTPQRSAQVVATFEAGNYVLLSMVKDAAGKPNYEQGLLTELTVGP